MSNPSVPRYTAEKIESAKKVLFDAGLQVRYEVAGAAYVDGALAKAKSSPDFSWPLQELVVGAAWGMVWTRPGLERKQRSLINLAMLCALNRPAELAIHVRGAINNGLTKKEMSETFLQVSIYCGMPAGIEGMKVAQAVLAEMEANGELQEEVLES
ncbi:putative 4-carboxymuconolactone decarboxylase [Xylariales sp. AK1849]|nr:putative 4-carboxymuconolactone decarboxylase [Xylariales sp. AK1849]